MPVARALWLLLLVLATAACRKQAPPEIALVPLPVLTEPRPGSFSLRGDLSLAAPGADAEVRQVAQLISGYLSAARGQPVRVVPGAAAPIVLQLDAGAPMPAEGYELTVSPQQIIVRAATPRGLFYGGVTLWQLLGADGAGLPPDHVPALRIVDAPRFPWRGLMLDTVRHFMPPEFIRQMIDWLALHKLNTLHLHLTDDQGWRLEIKKYPRLTEVGAWRKPTGAGADPDQKIGGWYSQEQLRELVRYAAERYVTIVPEIDMPGHMQAAIASYPWLGSSDAAPEVSNQWGIHPYLLNVDERTLGFVRDVLTEVMGLFPGRYVHVGGDEAIKDQWRASPRVQARMRELGVADEEKLQAWFMRQVEQFLSAHGRKLIGWDEIVDAGLPPAAAVMSWRGIEGGIAAARAGHDVVMSPKQVLYFNYRQGQPDEPPGRRPPITLPQVYRFDPVPSALDRAQAQHILGAQANVWSEFLETPDAMQRAVFPRLAALSEICWSPAAARDWSGFERRLPAQLARYRRLGIRYTGQDLRRGLSMLPRQRGAPQAQAQSFSRLDVTGSSVTMP